MKMFLFLFLFLFPFLFAAQTRAMSAPSNPLPLANFNVRDEMIARLLAKRPDVTVLDESAAATQKAKQVVAKIDQIFRAQFPQLMNNKGVADFVVVHSQSMSDDYAYLEQREDSYTGFFMIADGLFSPNVTDGMRIGIIAHEMAHVYFNHSDDYKILKSWRAGSTTPLSDTDQKLLTAYFNESKIASGFFDPHLEGFPIGEAVILEVFRATYSLFLFDRPDLQCVQNYDKLLNQKLLETNTILQKDISPLDGDIHFKSPDEAKKLQQIFAGTEKNIIDCSQSAKFKLDDLNLAHDFDLVGIQSNQIWETNANPFEILFNQAKSLHAKMRAQWTENKMSEFRWTSVEDQADEAALLVLKKLGINPKEYFQGFIGEGEKIEPNFAAKCSALSEEQTVGTNLHEPHHSICYRIKRLEKEI